MLGKNILMVVAPRNFRDEELLQPKQVFHKSGFRVTVASKAVAEASGVLGATVAVDVDLADASSQDFDAVVFVGGPGAEVYFEDEQALALARTFNEQGKVTAAICIAPTILANAGVLKGRRATVWSSMTNHDCVNALKKGGAMFTNEPVTVDGKIVTGNGPDAAQKFAEAVLKALG
ncbi:MAG: DJ-1/PfpI family protein [Methanobacteriota archaeon]